MPVFMLYLILDFTRPDDAEYNSNEAIYHYFYQGSVSNASLKYSITVPAKAGIQKH